MNYIERRDLQRKLKSLGHYSGRLDGKIGPKTEAGIISFKRSIGFRPRAKFGPLTRCALNIAFANIKPVGPALPGGGPDFYNFALGVRGLHESRDVSAVRKMLGKSFANYDPRNVPWCGAFIDAAMNSAGRGPQLFNVLGARQWLNFGVSVTACLGSVLVFWRGSPDGWKGHVGLYFGEDKTHYHVLGGNQANAVTVTRIAKNRLLGARLPAELVGKYNPRILSSAGVEVSENEA